MDLDPASEARAALRAFGTPWTMLCLGLLLLNDHVLKQAVPGLVTGKLSDVTGLVVAAALGWLLLALVRVPRPSDVALVAVGVAFTLAKVVPAVTDVVSAGLSLVLPSHVWTDPTDLLALPVLLLARHAHERARRRPGGARLRVAIGVLLAPFLVVATTATGACVTSPGVREVDLITGSFDGLPRGRETQVVLGGAAVLQVTPQVAVGPLLTLRDRDRLRTGPTLVQSCDPTDGLRCWRLPLTRPGHVEESIDGGATWRTVQTVEEDRVDALGEECGDPVAADLVDLAVLGTDAGSVVAVAGENLGLLVRAPDGAWQWIEDLSFLDSEEYDPTPAPGKRVPLGRGKLVSREVSPVVVHPFKHLR